MSQRARVQATNLVNRRLSEGVHQPFLRSMHRFQGSMTTLRQINQKLTPTISGWPDESAEEFQAAISPYPQPQQEALVDLAKKAIPGLAQGTLIFKVPDQSANKAEEGASDPEDDVATAWRLVADQLEGDMGAAYQLLHILYRKSTTPELAQTFHRSLLVSAVAALDVLMLDLIRHFYLLHPDALGNEMTFTLADLSEFSDLKEARLAAVERKADKVVRGGLASWRKWLKDQGIDLTTQCADWEKLVEILQRRHIAVHNGGVVSRSYQSKLQELAGIESPPDLGTLLQTDAEYLDAALDELEAVGNLLVGSVWTKCLPEAEDIVIFELYVRSYDLLLAERWSPTACICVAAKKRLKPDDDLYLIHKVNAWIARKRMGEGVSHEVSAWPTGTLSNRFRAARAALLDDFDELDGLLRKCLQAGDLELADAWEWPLFQEFRNDARWQEIVRSFSPRESD